MVTQVTNTNDLSFVTCRYFLHGESPFVIDEVSGEIKTGTEIGRQIQQVFRLSVEARDSNPVFPLNSFANITIRVENPKTDVHIFKGFKGEGN